MTRLPFSWPQALDCCRFHSLAGIRLYHEAMKAIHRWDGQAIVFANPMGQAGVDAGKFPDCARSYRGKHMQSDAASLGAWKICQHIDKQPK